MTTARIVEAGIDDVADILGFIRDLAKFEKLEREVAATERSLRETLFGPRKYAEVVFVEEEGERVGFAIFFHNYSTFLGRPGLYLEDLYIRPEKRGQGYGKLLLRHLAGLAVARGCGRLEWWVLDWNRGAIDFYRSLGAEPMSDWTVYRLSGDALRASGVVGGGRLKADRRKRVFSRRLAVLSSASIYRELAREMARTDFTTPRLCLDCDLSEGATAALSLDEANYLLNVLRLTRGARVLAFNGRDGEFAATIGAATRKSATLTIGERIRPQEFPPDVDYLFAPLKHARLDYMAQKAVEMGARRLQPVITRRTQASRVNLARLAANAREAAEQCGVIWLPEVSPERRLEEVLAAWPAERLLIFCDEDAPLANPVAGLATEEANAGVSLLIGPEGGFEESERQAIARLPRALRLSLGPRVLRADTAAVAALALIQSRFGDWR